MSSITSVFNLLKKYVNEAPKSALVFAIIGVVSLMAALVLALNTHGAPKSNVALTNTSSSDAGTSDKKLASSDAVLGATSDDSTATKPTNSSNATSNGNNKTSTASTVKHSTATTPGGSATTSSNQAQTVKADYNLNDNLYLATSSTMGLYNTCWPTPLTIDNEAQCGDINNPASQTWFIGIGINANANTAQSIADNQANQKAAAQHVVPKKGAGSDPAILTEALCAQYALSCGRW